MTSIYFMGTGIDGKGGYSRHYFFIKEMTIQAYETPLQYLDDGGLDKEDGYSGMMPHHHAM